ncbi:MBL fold metallo-hydrolase [Palleniella muris]|uniref:MBL fold metallo-hydrolase n=1 Tax=Palleniella muris TaxID=3038145 RepID=A0AC61QTM2_9BACT|nr:MBL fold metallo-hydrolase [Palleniella muris]TGX83904.1 MBL fold metallo-hydrolase [Palleniella muris]
MKITIHRGANQIGGCITTISSGNCKILIDFGSNLPGSKKEELSEEQIKDIAENADAVFYTHYHGDHVGLHHLIPSKIKQYIGAGAKEVMLCKYETLNEYGDYSQHIKATKTMLPYYANRRIDVGGKGEIFVTPYFVSHSAFDAYMLTIECEGKTILHTGDFRKHGYLGKGLIPTLEKYVGTVDILITEGTMLGRKQEQVVSENELQRNVTDILKEHKYVFALCSSTDIDRLASFNASCKDTGRVFVVDEYQNKVLDIFSKYAGKHTVLYRFNPFRLINFKTENVKKKLIREGFLMLIRASSLPLVERMMDIYNDEKSWLIYSMWGGYTEDNRDYANKNIITIRNFFEGRVFDGTKNGVHTSGHADVHTLAEVCNVVNPRIGVIPIHKDKYSEYESLPDISKYKIFHEGNTTIENISISIQ